LGHVERDALAVVVELPVADREDLALLRLLLGGVRKDDAGSGRRVFLDGLDDQAIAQGLEIHRVTSHSVRTERNSVLALSARECQPADDDTTKVQGVKAWLALFSRECQSVGVCP